MQSDQVFPIIQLQKKKQRLEFNIIKSLFSKEEEMDSEREALGLGREETEISKKDFDGCSFDVNT